MMTPLEAVAVVVAVRESWICSDAENRMPTQALAVPARTVEEGYAQIVEEDDGSLAAMRQSVLFGRRRTRNLMRLHSVLKMTENPTCGQRCTTKLQRQVLTCDGE